MRDRINPPPAPRKRKHARPTLSRAEFTRRTLIVAGIAALFVAVGTAFALAHDVFFLFFAAVLLAVLLRSVSDPLSKHTGIGPRWSLALVVLVLLALTGLGGYFAGSTVAGQLTQLSEKLPSSVDQARAQLAQTGWGREVLDRAPSARNLMTGGTGNMASSVTRFFSTTFGWLGNLLVLVFLTLYMAATPRQYLTGALVLVPPRRRDRAERVLNAVGFHLKWWLIGRAVSMVAVAVITGVGLAILNVPGYLILALLSGLLTAVPFIGPIVAALPAVLIALVQGPTTALWVVGVYVLAQAVENYLLAPLLTERFVNLPPVLTIIAVTLVGALFGILGLIVAAPLVVAVMVLVKTLYVEDTLGEDLKVPGEDRTPLDGQGTVAV